MKTHINLELPSLFPIRLSWPMVALFSLVLALGATTACFPGGVVGFSLLFLLFATCFVRPYVGLFLIVIFMPVKSIVFVIKSPIRQTPDLIHLYFIPVVIVFLLYSIYVLSKADSTAPKNPIAGIASAVFGWSIISLFWTDDVNHGVNTLLSFVECVLVVPLFGYFLKDKAVLNKLLIFTFLVGIAISGLTTLSYWYYSKGNIELYKGVKFSYGLNKEKDRPGGLAPANHTANLLALFIMVDIALFRRTRSVWARAFIALAFFYAIFNIFFTGSKGGVGALLVGALFLIVTVRSLRKKAVLWFAVIGFSIFLSMLGTSLITGESLLKQRTIASAGVSSISFNTRIEFWTKGLEAVWNSWGFGTGIGGFAKLVDPWPAAHSAYFSGLFDLGVVGFALLTWMFFKLIFFIVRSVQRCADEEIRFTAMCLISYLVVFLVHGLVDFDYVYFPAWMVISLLIATLHIGSASPGPVDAARGAETLPAPAGPPYPFKEPAPAV